MNVSAGSRCLSRLTASTVKPREPYCFVSVFIQGNDLRHGSHHEAQKSTSTTLPRSESIETGPFAPGRVKLGAGMGGSDFAVASAGESAPARMRRARNASPEMRPTMGTRDKLSTPARPRSFHTRALMFGSKGSRRAKSLQNREGYSLDRPRTGIPAIPGSARRERAGRYSRGPMFSISPSVVEFCQRSPELMARLDRLPESITELAARWELSVEERFDGEGEASWVAPV